MTAGMSLTDIAATLSLDSTPLIKGLKLAEQKFVEFGAIQAKAFEIALPDYQKQVQHNPLQFLQQRFGAITESNYKREAKVFADAITNDIDAARAEAQRVLDDMLASHQERGFLPDQGMAHVELHKAQEGIIRQQLLNEQIAIRNREEMLMASLRREQQAAIENAKQTAQAEAEIVERSAALQSAIRERYAKEDAALMLPLAKANAEKIRKFNEDADAYLRRAEEERKQKLINDYNKSPAFVPGYGNYAAAISNMQAVADAEVEIADRSTALREAILARYATEADNKRKRAKELDDKAYEENKRRSQEAASADIQIQKNTADVERSIAAKNLALREQDSREAESIINRLKTAQELHNERVATYTRLLKTVNVETGKTYLTTKQYNEAVKESERVMRASASGAGAYTGMLAQASFAAEDFIQGIAMGDLRSALLGASNNLTMVARGAFQAAEGVTVLGMGLKVFLGYLIGIPAAVAGLTIAFAEVNRAKRETLSLDEAIREAQQGYGIREINQQAKERARDEKLRIENIDTILQAEKDLKKQTEDQLKLRERLTMEETKRSATASRMIENLMGGPMAVTEFEQIMNNMKNSGDQASKDLALAMERNVSQATQALTSGDVNRSIQNLRELYERMNDIIYSRNRLEDVGSGLNEPFESLQYLINDPTALDSLEELFQAGVVFAGENDQAINDLRDKMTQVGMESLRIRKELEQATANEQQLEQRLEELRAEGLRLLNEQFKEKQRIAEQQRQENAAVIAAEAEALEQRRKRQLFDMTATEHQKEMLRIQEQMQEFMGPAGIVQGFAMPGVLGAPEMLGQLFQQGQAAGMQFLQAQATMLENEMAALRKASSPEILGGMQQDAFQAQADAFKQMFAAANKQNPQLTALGQKLDAIRNAIQSGNILQVVGQ